MLRGTVLTPLRRVVVWDSDNEREIVLLTNHLKFGANIVSAIYKDRWRIENFFKALKQNLKVKTFVGTTENALYIQIWTALIAMLLIKYLQFKGFYAHKNCPHILRRVVVWDPENEREIVLLTNHLKFGANTISAIYKERWEIELFFKALKQNLKIKTFVGTSENALYIQIWTALIAMLLIKYLQFKSNFAWSLSNLVAFLRWNLFTYRDLWGWIDHPFDVLPIQPMPVQHLLSLPGLGQHLSRETT